MIHINFLKLCIYIYCALESTRVNSVILIHIQLFHGQALLDIEKIVTLFWHLLYTPRHCTEGPSLSHYATRKKLLIRFCIEAAYEFGDIGGGIVTSLKLHRKHIFDIYIYIYTHTHTIVKINSKKCSQNIH